MFTAAPSIMSGPLLDARWLINGMSVGRPRGQMTLCHREGWSADACCDAGGPVTRAGCKKPDVKGHELDSSRMGQAEGQSQQQRTPAAAAGWRGQ